MSRSHAEHLLEYSARLFAMTDEERAAEDRRHDASGRAVGDFGAPPAEAAPPVSPVAPETPAPLPADDPKAAVGSFAPPPAPLVAYTDGSGTRAHLPCGAGVVVYDGDVATLEASRHLGLGTNNHAELSGIRIALAITDTPEWRGRVLVIRTDSEYAHGALTAPNPPRAGAPNERLINLTRELLAGRTVRFEHVPGRKGIEGNERADHLAGIARKRVPADRSAA